MNPHKAVLNTVPVSLTGLFFNENDSDFEEEENKFENESQVVELDLAGKIINIKQLSWHQANANQVWPGTFALIEHIAYNTNLLERYQTGKILELGAATGALSIGLIKLGKFDLITSDIDDGGDVKTNIKWNFDHNEILQPIHYEHTWGTGWNWKNLGLKFIIASDILLYVSAYDALVQTLVELFDQEEGLIEFLMAWNRRIKESSIFFDKMNAAGFQMHSYGKGIYSFTRESRCDLFLEDLFNGNQKYDHCSGSNI